MNKDWLKQDLLVYEIKQQGSTLMEAHVKGILRLSDKECTVLEQARDLMEDLAEQAVDDLMDIDDMDEEKAAALIMTARAPWFAEEQGE